MSLSLNISARAEADLTHQYRWYLDNAGFKVAERFLEAFDATLVFYRSTESELKIMRVMHGARNLPTRLLEPPK